MKQNLKKDKPAIVALKAGDQNSIKVGKLRIIQYLSQNMKTYKAKKEVRLHKTDYNASLEQKNLLKE